MEKFIIQLRHDGGTVAVSTWASSRGKAVKQVLAFEGAPQSAVLKVEKVK